MINKEDKALFNMIQELENSHLRPDIRKSVEKLGELLADDFIEIGSSGKKFGKNECLKGGVALDEMTLHDFEMRHLSEQAVLTTYRVQNHTKNRTTLRSSIWQKMNGRWRLYFHQGTLVNQ
ncbi:DUF4440 domain-containing protein [Alkalicoccobacillus porphyridii]|uniref:DUF4440 domain-containing protein n=1 Tax=Alkalicoccobacillus porphyridii TaxID=2597270 RepID=A0A553ZX27_9BACI|nr:DUF4440 domain-containing protein [Alkalicoccobacillus porphyridii]TSB46001.1 DUF4440 domain-containing protein [Alkalicoccobacillus porphyridii]